jgi:hypothetical protein
MRRVPVARRNLLADWRRLVISVFGVGVALMLILLLDGLWAGIRSQVTTYEDHSGAELYVVTPGTFNLFADSSTVPRSALDEVRAIPGVQWAAPVRTSYTILELHGRKVAVALVGSIPGLCRHRQRATSTDRGDARRRPYGAVELPEGCLVRAGNKCSKTADSQTSPSAHRSTPRGCHR